MLCLRFETQCHRRLFDLATIDEDNAAREQGRMVLGGSIDRIVNLAESLLCPGSPLWR